MRRPSRRVLVCPDKFAGTLSAPAAAEAIALGWRDVAPDDEVTCRPLADGGPGFLDVLEPHLPTAVRRVVPAVGPLGVPVLAALLVAGDTGRAAGVGGMGGTGRAAGVGGMGGTGRAAGVGGMGGTGRAAGVGGMGGTAYIEAAQACGLDLLAPHERDPLATTTYGVGELVSAAIRAGARRVVVGLGGSASNDGGAGLLAALGAVPVDATGHPLPRGGAALAGVAALRGEPRLGGVMLVGASDVDSPLTGPFGASAVFGPQKGATAEQVALLDAALARFASVLERALASCPPGLAARPGAGAAGGLGAAILACGGRLVSGFELVRRVTNLDAALDACDVVITGEGSFDDQSLRGKAVAGVAAAARERGLPCVVLAGRATADRSVAREAGVTRSYGLVEHLGGDVALALSRPADGLRSLAAHVARAANDTGAVRAGTRVAWGMPPGPPGVAHGDDRPTARER